MKKYNINGTEYVTVKELRHVIRMLRRLIPTAYQRFDKDHQSMVHLAYNDVVRQLYLDELKAAKTPEEHEAILEMPGEFMVYKPGANNHRVDYQVFVEWRDGEPVTAHDGGMIFGYESKAREIAERLGDGWTVIDVSQEAYEDAKRLLSAIFDEIN